MAPGKQHFKIKLGSGRILGPLDLERIRLLMLKKQIVGNEQAREYPNGDWRPFHLVPQLAQLLVRKAEGKLEDDFHSATGAGSGTTQLLQGATKVLVPQDALEELPEIATNLFPDDPPEQPKAENPADQKVEIEKREEEEEKTVMAPRGEFLEDDRTVVAPSRPKKKEREPEADVDVDLGSRVLRPVERNISQEKTVMFQKASVASNIVQHAPPVYRRYLRPVMLGLFIVALAIEAFVNNPQQQQGEDFRIVHVRPRLPEVNETGVDAKKSEDFYKQAVTLYWKDNVIGYRKAAQLLHESLKFDGGNVKALAMLASTYLNLIDSSNKDENYFNVISELIMRSRAKNMDIAETVIADVEFYITVNKPEAAQDRIIKYTSERQGKFGLEMFYYLALAYYHRGEMAQAARYLTQFPEDKAFTPKIAYLRGRVAEALSDSESALKEYEKAIKFDTNHARSRLRVAEIFSNRGDLKAAAPHLEYLVNHPDLSSPTELASAFYFHSLLSESFKKTDRAIADIEKAVKLAPGNHDYSLQLYVLRAAAGGSINKKIQKEAQMYLFLGNGERKWKQGQYHEALTDFLDAQKANDKSPLPYVKIGDMSKTLHKYADALYNYKRAADRAKDDIEIWSKYIDMLIQCYEWEAAMKAMDRFRNMRVPQSAIDKAAADIYAKQGQYAEAISHYKKAMGRDSIDPGVYLSYADTLLATKNNELVKHAPFFYALALRFDPLNFNAITGTAKAIAATESIDRAITMLQDELQKGTAAKAELLSAIAEFQIQKGDLAKAEENLEQAMRLNPSYAAPWKLQAQIYVSRENTDKHALEKALDAYRSYSDRNPSDPSGYLECYNILSAQLKFDKAEEELNKIYAIYPKYPGFHHFKGVLFSKQGNQKMAIVEFEAELKNNPNNVKTLMEYGKELVKMGSYDKALVNFNTAAQLAPTYAEAKHMSGYANHLLKNYQGAVALYRGAIALDPGNSMIYKRLGLAYREMGDNFSASEAFRKYLEMEPDAPDRAIFERLR